MPKHNLMNNLSDLSSDGIAFGQAKDAEKVTA
jgi:hypothetical protein